MKINKLIHTLCFTSLLILGSCTKKDGSTSTENTLRVDVGTELPTFDPALAEDGNTYRVINDLFAGLVDFDQANRPIPGMAKSWEISSDGKIYTFHLRDNLKFSDGSPITADDFVFSWRRLIDPKTGSSYAFLLKDVLNGQKIIDGKEKPERLGVIALDPETFVVHLEHPTNAFLSYITTPNVFVVPRKIIEKYGQNWTKPEHMVTSGAYILKEHVVNGYILATKNPNFYEESSVKIKNVKYFPFTDTNASLSNFKTGALDTTWQNVPIDQYKQLQKQFPDELHTFKWERMDYLNLNFQLPKFANNLKLRQALAMAINREDLTQKVLGAGQTPLYSTVTPTIENGKYADLNYSWSKLPHDKQVQMAKELYKEAGYGPNNPLTLTIKYQTNDLYKKVMISVMSMWQETLGVKVKLVNEEMKVLFPELRNGNYEVAQGRWGADYNSVTTYTPLFICNNGNNRSHYCNKNYDTLITKAEATSNPAQQQQLYKQALQLAMNEYAIIPLYEPTHQRLVNKRVKGYDIDSNYLDNVQTKWFNLDLAK